MASTHKTITTYQIDGVTIDSGTTSVTDDGGESFDGTVPATSTHNQIALAFTQARLKSIWIKSDQDLTLFTNANDGAGGDTFNLKAHAPVAWNINNGLASPLAHDVTTLYVDNGTSVIANLKIRVALHDS